MSKDGDTLTSKFVEALRRFAEENNITIVSLFRSLGYTQAAVYYRWKRKKGASVTLSTVEEIQEKLIKAFGKGIDISFD